jgi:uncharacterized CHY-type Zn-finger protein
MPFVAQPSEKCFGCGKTVFATEKVVVEEAKEKKVFHKTCIRCASCNKVLGVGDFVALEGKMYCKPHFNQLFKTKGNFDESFGKEKTTSKWESTPVAAPSTFLSPFLLIYHKNYENVITIFYY